MLGKILKTIVDTAVGLPVAVVKDVLTLGGVATKGELEPYTKDKVDEIIEDLEDIA